MRFPGDVSQIVLGMFRDFRLILAPLATAALITVCGCSLRPESSMPLAKERVRFEETTAKLGLLSDCTEARHEFVFTNVSGKPVRVVSVRPVCGCRVDPPAFSNAPVLPGDEGKIVIAPNCSKNSRKTTESYSATFESEGESFKSLLSLDYTLAMKLRFDRASLYFDRKHVSNSALQGTAHLIISDEEAKQMDAILVESSSPEVQAVLGKITKSWVSQEGDNLHSIEVAVRVSPKALSNSLSESVIAHLSTDPKRNAVLAVKSDN